MMQRAKMAGLDPAGSSAFRNRDGFALMATLWVVVAVTALTLSMARAAQLMMNGSRNRANQRVATWQALGCLAHIRAAIANEASIPDRMPVIWDSLDQYVRSRNDGCEESAIASGTTLDINRASGSAIRATLMAAGITTVVADSVVRLSVNGDNQPFGSAAEMHYAKGGLLSRYGLDSLFGIDSASANMRTPEVVRLGMAIDLSVNSTADSVESSITRSGTELSRSIQNLRSTITRPPDAWWLRIEASHGDPSVTVRLETHLVLFGTAVSREDIRL
jgi:hypothetical protein